MATAKLSKPVWDCAIDESNERCLRGAGDDNDDEAAECEGGVRRTDTGVAAVGVDGEFSISELAAAAAAAEIDSAGTSDRLWVNML